MHLVIAADCAIIIIPGIFYVAEFEGYLAIITDLTAIVANIAGGTLPTGGRASLNWQTDAAAWLSFILIVAFLAAGIHCLTNMQFKKDSLLYGRAKAD